MGAVILSLLLIIIPGSQLRCCRMKSVWTSGFAQSCLHCLIYSDFLSNCLQALPFPNRRWSPGGGGSRKGIILKQQHMAPASHSHLPITGSFTAIPELPTACIYQSYFIQSLLPPRGCQVWTLVQGWKDGRFESTSFHLSHLSDPHIYLLYPPPIF